MVYDIISFLFAADPVYDNFKQMVVYLAGPTRFRSNRSISKEFSHLRVRKVEVFNLDLSAQSQVYIRMTFDNNLDLSTYLAEQLGCDVLCLGEEQFWVSDEIVMDDAFPEWGKKWLDGLKSYPYKGKFLIVP